MSMPDANDIIDGLMREASLSKAIFHAAEAGLDLEVRGVRFVHERNLDAENAKLRKLIADLHALDDLRYIPAWEVDEYGVRMADIERRMRGVGMEVGE